MTEDRLVRADRIVSIDLWGPSLDQDGKRTNPVLGRPARIMVQVQDEEPAWLEAARVDAEQGGELITRLLTALATAEGTAGLTYVYGLQHSGRTTYRWKHGSALPVDDEHVSPLHRIDDPAPGRGLVFSVNGRN
ncbi:hypothetical protein CTZ27_31145 [Streptomyces griseocarneus]|nr:hypothetical protein CTZ27_31145 [Streptomyces griseocarneus]